MKKVALIVNPVSGRGRGRKAALEARDVLVAGGLEVTIAETEKVPADDGILRGNGPALAKFHATTADAVIAVGGDGTLGEVIAGLRGVDVPVGIIPVGTANVVSRDLGIPRTPAKAAAVLLGASPRRLDVGDVNGRLFLAMVGVGFDGEVVHRIAKARRGPITMATYVKPALSALAHYRATPLEVTVDGVPLAEPAYGIIVSNTRNYGGLFSVTPDADLADGWLDFQTWRRPGRFAMFRCSLAAGLRRRAAPAVAGYGRGRSFTISAKHPVSAQVDGDHLGTTPLSIRLLPDAVRIIAPNRNGAPRA